MANWREIIISGSDADLRSVSSSLATIETALTSSGTTKLNLGTDVGVTDIVVAAADGTLYRNDSLGLKGQKGEIGAQGVSGDLGSKGDVGPQGAIGTQGTNGTKGATGDKGNVGVKGDIGTQGETGTKGEVGTQGAIGTQGEIGAQGIQGIIGSQGTDGAQGTDGEKGQKGEIGVKGDLGPQGTDGNFGGASFDYTFDDSTDATDPTTGFIKLNATQQNTATALYIDSTDDNSNSINSFWIC